MVKDTNMANYEIGIYNKNIRDKLANGDRVEGEQAKWEEVHYFEIKADDKKQAIKIIRSDYPEIRGFVIECVNEMGSSNIYD